MEFDPVLSKIRTPIDLINIAGCGGFLFGSMLEAWGPPSSGKSTFCYQMAELFLEDYGDDAIVLILDAENSANILRLAKVFNIKPSNVKGRPGDPRVFLEPGVTVELCSATIHKYIKIAESTGKFLYVIWDSITASQPQREYDAIDAAAKAVMSKDITDKDIAEAYAGGMMLKPRVLASQLNSILMKLYQAPVFIALINQARTSIGKYSTTEDSPGGYALKHNIHYRIKFEFSKVVDVEGIIRKSIQSNVLMNKSKHMPALQAFPIFIQDSLGGKINSGLELAFVALSKEMGWILNKGSWHSLNDELLNNLPEGSTLKKNYRWLDLVENQEFKDLMKSEFLKYFRSNFSLVDYEYEEIQKCSKEKKND